MDSEEHPLESTTRTFDTTEGVLTYAELSDLIAPKLLKLLDDITNGEFINRPYDESLITDFHYRIIGKVIPDIAGKWRSVPVGVGNWLPPEPFEIPIKMREYVNNMQVRINHADSLDLQIEALAYAEGEFLHIHPFQDFNGRTIRALLAELMMRFDLPRIDTSVPRGTEKYKQYQNALAEYDNGRMSYLVEFWQRRFEEGVNESGDESLARHR
mgnify:CR=1 FL=1